MTSVLDTHPPLIYVLISYVKEIGFWNQYLPTFYDNVLKIYSFFFRASLRGWFDTVIFKQNYFTKFIQFNFQIIFKYDIFPLEIASLHFNVYCQALCPFLCLCVCVSKSLRKWTQTDTKVTFHPPPTHHPPTRKLLLVPNER